MGFWVAHEKVQLSTAIASLFGILRASGRTQSGEQACLFSFSLPPQASSILFCNFYAYTCFFLVVTKKQIQLSKETLFGVLCISVQGRFTYSGPSLPFAQYFAK